MRDNKDKKDNKGSMRKISEKQLFTLKVEKRSDLKGNNKDNKLFHILRVTI